MLVNSRRHYQVPTERISTFALATTRKFNMSGRTPFASILIRFLQLFQALSGTPIGNQSFSFTFFFLFLSPRSIAIESFSLSSEFLNSRFARPSPPLHSLITRIPSSSEADFYRRRLYPETLTLSHFIPFLVDRSTLLCFFR